MAGTIDYVRRRLERTGVGRVPFVEDIYCWLLARTNGTVTIRGVEFAPVTDGEAVLYYATRDELPVLDVWMEQATGATCVLDIGAAIGLYALTAGTNASSAEIHAFEPSPARFRVLKANAAANDIPVHAHRVVVGSDDRPLLTLGTTGSHVTQQTTIDALSLQPDLMKIDVEGYELRVLEGAHETIRRHRPTIFLEVHDKVVDFGDSLSDLTDFTDRIGYEKTELATHSHTQHWLLSPGNND